jgi:predicted cobalt transporter CbtA
MSFDIRLPVGLLFTAIGLLVILAGLTTRHAGATGVDIDLVWGGVMTGFGLFMLALTRIHRHRPRP